MKETIRERIAYLEALEEVAQFIEDRIRWTMTTDEDGNEIEPTKENDMYSYNRMVALKSVLKTIEKEVK